VVFVRRDPTVVLGADPSALNEAPVERTSRPARVQFDAAAKRLVWLYTSTQSSVW